eukprot:COSAG01_NODE_5637_length_4126_cov_12.068041_3_plen_84_part_00
MIRAAQGRWKCTETPDQKYTMLHRTEMVNLVPSMYRMLVTQHNGTESTTLCYRDFGICWARSPPQAEIDCCCAGELDQRIQQQ